MAFVTRIGKGSPLTATDYDGNISETIAQLATKCATTDPRLSDARAPTAHTQAQSTIDGLVDALAAKATTSALSALTTEVATKVAGSDSRLTNARAIADGNYGIITVASGAAQIRPAGVPDGDPVTIVGIDASNLLVKTTADSTAEVPDTVAAFDEAGDAINFTPEDLAAWAGDAFAAYLAVGGVGVWREPVRVATQTNVTLATGVENGDSLNGVTLATGDRVLLTSQTTASENGVYVVNTSGAPTRASDADSEAELKNALYFVTAGYSRGSVFINTNTSTITIGSTSITYDLLQSGTAQGADVASGSTVTLGGGGMFTMTGTGTVTAFAFNKDFVGRRAVIRASGASTLTHNGTSLILPGARPILLGAGDVFEIVSLGSGNFALVSISYASTAFTAVTPSGGNVGINGDAVRFSISVAISGNIDFNSLTNLVIGQHYHIEVSATGGPRSVTATGAGRTFNFGAGISIPSGKGAIFDLVYNGSQSCLIFCGYRD